MGETNGLNMARIIRLRWWDSGTNILEWSWWKGVPFKSLLWEIVGHLLIVLVRGWWHTLIGLIAGERSGALFRCTEHVLRPFEIFHDWLGPMPTHKLLSWAIFFPMFSPIFKSPGIMIPGKHFFTYQQLRIRPRTTRGTYQLQLRTLSRSAGELSNGGHFTGEQPPKWYSYCES